MWPRLFITFSTVFGLLGAANVPVSFRKLIKADMVSQVDELGLAKTPSLRFDGDQAATKAVSAGESVELRCEAFGNPAPVVYWTHNGQPVASEKPESNWYEKLTNMGSRTYQVGATVAIMRIPCAKNSHVGMYTCVASNGHKQIERNVELMVGEGMRRTVKIYPGHKFSGYLRNFH